MAYVQGGDILASDYNAMLNSVLNIYGAGGTGNGEPDGSFGYGQSALSLNPVSQGDTVRSAEWVNLRNMISLIAQHQGTTVSLPPVSALATDANILAHPPAQGDLPGSITAIRNNRLKSAPGSTTLVQNALHIVMATGWTNKVEFDFRATFANANQARYFYNTGGQIRVRAVATGGAETAENLMWKNLLSDSGAVQFKAYETTSTNTSIVIQKGYYNLFSYSGGGSTIWEKGANANGLVAIDTVINVYVDYLIATNPFSVIGPTIAVVP